MLRGLGDLWPVIAQLVTATPAHAQAQVEFIPSVSLFTVFDDNIFARANGSAGQMLQLRPSFEGSYEIADVRLLGLYSFDMQRSNFSSLNTLDARRHALGETRFRTTPFTTLGMAAGTTAANAGRDQHRHRHPRRAPAGRAVELDADLRAAARSADVDGGGYDWTSENLVDGERGTMHIGRIGLSRDVTTRTVDRRRATSAATSSITSTDSRLPLARGARSAGAGSWRPAHALRCAAGPKVTSYRGPALRSERGVRARDAPGVRLALDYWHGETIVLGVGARSRRQRDRPCGLADQAPFEFGTMPASPTSRRSTSEAARSTAARSVGSWSPGGIYTVAATYGARLPGRQHPEPDLPRRRAVFVRRQRSCGTCFA